MLRTHTDLDKWEVWSGKKDAIQKGKINLLYLARILRYVKNSTGTSSAKEVLGTIMKP